MTMFHKMLLTVAGLLVIGAGTDLFADYVLTGSYPNGDTYTDLYVTGTDGTILYKERTTKRNGKPISKVRYYWVPGANGHFGWNNPTNVPLPSIPAMVTPGKGAVCPPTAPAPSSNPNWHPSYYQPNSLRSQSLPCIGSQPSAPAKK
jgi:hypothetical protein